MIIQKFQAIFSEKPGITPQAMHNKVDRQPAYSCKTTLHSPTLDGVVEVEIQNMLEGAVSEPRDSNDTSHFIDTEQLRKKPMPCVDYRRSNDISVELNALFYPT